MAFLASTPVIGRKREVCLSISESKMSSRSSNEFLLTKKRRKYGNKTEVDSSTDKNIARKHKHGRKEGEIFSYEGNSKSTYTQDVPESMSENIPSDYKYLNEFNTENIKKRKKRIYQPTVDSAELYRSNFKDEIGDLTSHHSNLYMKQKKVPLGSSENKKKSKESEVMVFERGVIFTNRLNAVYHNSSKKSNSSDKSLDIRNKNGDRKMGIEKNLSMSKKRNKGKEKSRKVSIGGENSKFKVPKDFLWTSEIYDGLNPFGISKQGSESEFEVTRISNKIERRKKKKRKMLEKLENSIDKNTNDEIYEVNNKMSRKTELENSDNLSESKDTPTRRKKKKIKLENAEQETTPDVASCSERLKNEVVDVAAEQQEDFNRYSVVDEFGELEYLNKIEFSATETKLQSIDHDECRSSNELTSGKNSKFKGLTSLEENYSSAETGLKNCKNVEILNEASESTDTANSETFVRGKRKKIKRERNSHENHCVDIKNEEIDCEFFSKNKKIKPENNQEIIVNDTSILAGNEHGDLEFSNMDIDFPASENKLGINDKLLSRKQRKSLKKANMHLGIEGNNDNEYEENIFEIKTEQSVSSSDTYIRRKNNLEPKSQAKVCEGDRFNSEITSSKKAKTNQEQEHNFNEHAKVGCNSETKANIRNDEIEHQVTVSKKSRKNKSNGGEDHLEPDNSAALRENKKQSADFSDTQNDGDDINLQSNDRTIKERKKFRRACIVVTGVSEIASNKEQKYKLNEHSEVHSSSETMAVIGNEENKHRVAVSEKKMKSKSDASLEPDMLTALKKNNKQRDGDSIDLQNGECKRENRKKFKSACIITPSKIAENIKEQEHNFNEHSETMADNRIEENEHPADVSEGKRKSKSGEENLDTDNSATLKRYNKRQSLNVSDNINSQNSERKMREMEKFRRACIMFNSNKEQEHNLNAHSEIDTNSETMADISNEENEHQVCVPKKKSKSGEESLETDNSNTLKRHDKKQSDDFTDTQNDGDISGKDTFSSENTYNKIAENNKEQQHNFNEYSEEVPNSETMADISNEENGHRVCVHKKKKKSISGEECLETDNSAALKKCNKKESDDFTDTQNDRDISLQCSEGKGKKLKKFRRACIITKGTFNSEMASNNTDENNKEQEHNFSEHSEVGSETMAYSKEEKENQKQKKKSKSAEESLETDNSASLKRYDKKHSDDFTDTQNDGDISLQSRKKLKKFRRDCIITKDTLNSEIASKKTDENNKEEEHNFNKYSEEVSNSKTMADISNEENEHQVRVYKKKKKSKSGEESLETDNSAASKSYEKTDDFTDTQNDGDISLQSSEGKRKNWKKLTCIITKDTLDSDIASNKTNENNKEQEHNFSEHSEIGSNSETNTVIRNDENEDQVAVPEKKKKSQSGGECSETVDSASFKICNKKQSDDFTDTPNGKQSSERNRKKWKKFRRTFIVTKDTFNSNIASNKTAENNEEQEHNFNEHSEVGSNSENSADIRNEENECAAAISESKSITGSKDNIEQSNDVCDPQDNGDSINLQTREYEVSSNISKSVDRVKTRVSKNNINEISAGKKSKHLKVAITKLENICDKTKTDTTKGHSLMPSDEPLSSGSGIKGVIPSNAVSYHSDYSDELLNPEKNKIVNKETATTTETRKNPKTSAETNNVELRKIRSRRLSKFAEEFEHLHSEKFQKQNDHASDISEISNSSVTLDGKALEDDLKILRKLKIDLPFSVPPLHNIADRPSKLDNKQLQKAEKAGIKVRTGPFSRDEDYRIIANWKHFCKVHDLKMSPTSFFSFRGGMSMAQRKNFLKFLAHGLDNRLLHRVHWRFQKLFGKSVQGRFSEKEDEVLLEFMASTTSSKPYTVIADMLGRTRESIEKRYLLLTRVKNTSLLKWTPELAEKFVNRLMQVTKTENVNDLRDVEITGKNWSKLSKKMDNIPVKKLQRAWRVTIYPRLFSDNVDLVRMKEKIIKILYKRREVDWRTVNWKEVASHFEGFTGEKVYSMFKHLVNFNVPEAKRDDLEECLYFLKNVYLKYGHISETSKFKRFVYKDGHLHYEEDMAEP